jgi:acetyltransferase-like isoleucine patch superfamily enzyme
VRRRYIALLLEPGSQTTLLQRLTNWRNPRNLTRLHLAALARRRGFSIGDHTYGRPKVRFADSGRNLTIGAYCSIADGVEIMLGGNHRTEWVATFPFGSFPDAWPGEGIAYVPGTRGDVTIGNDVWIGSGALILSGVTIGHGAAIGARAVVTRDVPAYGVVAGNPAKLLRRRFDDATVAQLIEAAWWDLPERELRNLVPLLQSDRVRELIAAVHDSRAQFTPR